MNVSSVLVAAAREIIGSGKSAAAVATELAGSQFPGDVSLDRLSVKALFTRGASGVQPSEARVAEVLDSLVGKSDTAGGSISVALTAGTRVYSYNEPE
jgi:hypothetical protein